MEKGIIKNYLLKILSRWFLIKPGELPALILSFIYFFCLLSSNYILRPFRDEMGIAGGVENLHWLFTGTFLAMLAVVPVFGYLTKHYDRTKFLPLVYLFFISNIILFYILFKAGFSIIILAPVFFIWLSVFNLFVVSVFWSLMADIFSNEQSKRLFGVIAAGGSAGAIAGPFIATMLAKPLGPVNLLLITVLLLALATFCIKKLIGWSAGNKNRSEKQPKNKNIEHPIGGGIFAGIKSVIRSRFLTGISAYVIFLTMIATILYFVQAYIVDQVFEDSSSRTTYFAAVDLATNILAVSSQFFITSRFIKRFGLAIMLAFIPVMDVIGLFSLSLVTLLPVLVLTQVIHRAGNFSLLRPGREILFTVTSREDRYKAKNFIDTAIYRGGDAATGWAFAGLISLGLGLSSITLIAVPIAGVWGLTGFYLGKKQRKYKDRMQT